MNIGFQRLFGAAPALSVMYEASRDVALASDAFSSQDNPSKTAPASPLSADQDALYSPQVLSEVTNEAVVLVDDFQFLRPGTSTAGRDSNAILMEAMMGTPERPARQLEEIRAVSALLDEGKHGEARVRLDALARELTEIDQDIVGLRTMLHFLEGDHEANPQGS